MSFRGYQRVQVVEDHCATRERFTFETAVRSWVEPGVRPKTAVCFKDGGKVGVSLNAGKTIKNSIANKHDDIMLQTSEKGSYKVDTLLEFFDWALPVAETRRSESVICVGGEGLGQGSFGYRLHLLSFKRGVGTNVRTYEFQAWGWVRFCRLWVRTYVRT